ncbi:MAG: CDP-alcohol phosphatidyltransferase family protein [Phycisphaerae bacterium]|nr:CDP-alcohol phosphatidyltransferase family protein [Gemmatimonadaceae bacterium]
MPFPRPFLQPHLSTDPAKPSGAYRFTDHSVLRPWVSRVWFARLFPLLPKWLAANLVTLMSTGALTSVLVASLFADRMGPAVFALVQLIAMQLYVAGDHLDGMQAAASGTTSPLGDFLDHHCDLWAGCVLCYGFWRLIGSTPDWLLPVLIGFMIVGFAITYVERAERKALHFTAWGTLEAMAIVTMFYLSWCFIAMREWWMQQLVGTLPRTMLVAGLGVVMALGVIVVIARRLTRVPVPLLLFVATVVALAFACFWRLSVAPMLAWFVMVLAGADYVARVMHAHTTLQPRPWPDLITALAVMALCTVPQDAVNVDATILALTVWLLVRYVITLTRILWGWRQHWVWINAREAKP